MSVTHSATSWRTSLSANNRFEIFNALSPIQPIAQIIGHKGRYQANAAYIVQCVNNHEMLMSALERLANECCSRFDYASTKREYAALEVALDALELARGGKA